MRGKRTAQDDETYGETKYTRAMWCDHVFIRTLTEKFIFYFMNEKEITKKKSVCDK